MPFITWNEKYSVKIQSIDDQHKKLIDMINDFYEEINKKSNHELIKDLLSKMKNYTEMHFSTEEKLFETHNLPNYADHIKEHRSFIQKVTELENKMQNGKIIVSYEITSFLKKWLTEHILCTDMQYVDFLKSKGVN